MQGLASPPAAKQCRRIAAILASEKELFTMSSSDMYVPAVLFAVDWFCRLQVSTLPPGMSKFRLNLHVIKGLFVCACFSPAHCGPRWFPQPQIALSPAWQQNASARELNMRASSECINHLRLHEATTIIHKSNLQQVLKPHLEYFMPSRETFFPFLSRLRGGPFGHCKPCGTASRPCAP